MLLVARNALGARICRLAEGMGRNRLRAVRGGAFNNNERNVRCAYRNRNNPNNVNRTQGFRVVAVHIFSGARPRRKCSAAGFCFRAEA